MTPTQLAAAIAEIAKAMNWCAVIAYDGEDIIGMSVGTMDFINEVAGPEVDIWQPKPNKLKLVTEDN